MTDDEKKERDDRRRKQTLRRTKEWYEKKRLTLSRAWSRFHPMELDPDNRTWYYDSYGAKRDKQTERIIDDE